MAVVTVAETKTYLNIATADTSYDAELAGFISTAVAVAESIVGTIESAAFTETHSGGSPYIHLYQSPVLSITSVTENGTALGSGDWALTGTGLLARMGGTNSYSQYCFTPGFRNVVVVYNAGRSAVPANVKEGVLEIIAHNWRRQQGGNVGEFDDTATGQGQFFPSSGFYLPNSVIERLRPSARGPLVA